MRYAGKNTTRYGEGRLKLPPGAQHFASSVKLSVSVRLPFIQPPARPGSRSVRGGLGITSSAADHKRLWGAKRAGRVGNMGGPLRRSVKEGRCAGRQGGKEGGGAGGRERQTEDWGGRED